MLMPSLEEETKVRAGLRGCDFLRGMRVGKAWNLSGRKEGSSIKVEDKAIICRSLANDQSCGQWSTFAYPRPKTVQGNRARQARASIRTDD